MKLIIAIIQPYRIDAVREALTEVGVEGLTVSEVRGYGRQRGQKEIYRGAEYSVSYVPKLKLEIAVVSEKADDVVEAIRARPAPARSATVRSSCFRWTRPSASAPVKSASRRSSAAVRHSRVAPSATRVGAAHWPSLTHFPITIRTCGPMRGRSLLPEIGDLT